MNFVADESVDRDIVIAMRACGHRVAYVAVRSYFASAGLLLELFW